MAGLTSLADLALSFPGCTSGGFSQLSHLAASLTALCLDWCSELPACLSLLTGLRCLTVAPTYEESGGEPEEVVALLQAGLAPCATSPSWIFTVSWAQPWGLGVLASSPQGQLPWALTAS